MKQEFLIEEGHSRLLLLFAGWGGEANLFSAYHPLDADYLLVSDYRTLDFDVEPLKRYSEIDIVGWSMGVWMAAHVLSGLLLPIRWARAVNGTPHPIDNRYGIPVDIFRGTLDGFSPVVLQKFRRRMCGNTAGVKAFLGHLLTRPMEELQSELQAIYEVVTTQTAKPFEWTEAWIGKQDLIFPLVNQENAWQLVKRVYADEPHYSELMFHQILES